MPKNIYILRGPPGAGKTTYVKDHLPNAWYCSADKYFETDNGYEFDPHKLPEAHQACMFHFLTGLTANKNPIIIDNTFTQEWEYINYKTAGLLVGYNIHILEFIPQTIKDLKLIAKRNTHGVPETIIAAMAMRFEPDDQATQISILASIQA